MFIPVGAFCDMMETSPLQKYDVNYNQCHVNYKNILKYVVSRQLMPVGALCDMMESISIASKDYRAVLVGMVRIYIIYVIYVNIYDIYIYIMYVCTPPRTTAPSSSVWYD